MTIENKQSPAQTQTEFAGQLLEEFKAEFQRLQSTCGEEQRDGAVDLHFVKAFKRTAGKVLPEGKFEDWLYMAAEAIAPLTSWGAEGIYISACTRYSKIRTSDILTAAWNDVSPRIKRERGWTAIAVLEMAKYMDTALESRRKSKREGEGILLPQERLAELLGVKQQAVSHIIHALIEQGFLAQIQKSMRNKRIAARYVLGHKIKPHYVEPPADFR